MQFEFGFSDERQRSRILAKKNVHRWTRPLASPAAPALPGLEYGRTHKVFFALQPEVEAAAEAYAIPNRINLIVPKRCLVPQENLHATLHLIAQQEGIPRSLIETACEPIRAVNTSQFDVIFDRLENFVLDPPRHALVLLCDHGLEPLIDLHRQIGTALRQLGFKRIGKSFVPHVTLAYNTEPFATPPITPISWTVNQFVLIESPHGKGEHLIQGRWMLTDAERMG